MCKLDSGPIYFSFLYKTYITYVIGPIGSQKHLIYYWKWNENITHKLSRYTVETIRKLN